MLPKFPNLKKVEISDFKDIEALTHKFPPYNDFEFASLWTYDTRGKNEIGLLNENLVVKIQDFLSGDLFYSFIGTTMVDKTIATLLESCKKEGLEEKLYLVPEVSIKEIKDSSRINIVNDLDSADYILSIDELSSLAGKKYYDKRNLVNRFKKNYPEHNVEMLDLDSPKIQNELLELFLKWEKNKNKKSEDTEIELIAVKKLFSILNLLNVSGLGVHIDNQLVGFSTYHKIDNDYAIMTFEKGDISFEGIYSYLNHKTAIHLSELGAKYLNYEQDLGIPGLKKAKQLWRPVFYLNKYSISPK
jgi:hypothetical protein